MEDCGTSACLLQSRGGKGRIKMRKLKRIVAKYNMKKCGIHKPFKKIGGESYFSQHWREYLN